MAKQKYIWWHQVIESEHKEFPKGNIIGLNKRESEIHISDKSNQKNIYGLRVKFKYFGRILIKENDPDSKQIDLIKLFKEKNIPLTAEMQKFARKHGIL